MRKFLFLFVVVSGFTHSQQIAQDLFSQYQNALYQIRIIELGSGNKSSIGSGFQINQEGLMVTNYHVISEYVFYPEKYRIEYLDANGQTGSLELKDFDVINDLALVSKISLIENEDAFELATDLPEQGSNIYSLGNPHDLGMIVVPGTFNGLKKNSFYQRIHFTGSINPGMSGGPVVNSSGHIVGVNVATAGNQIGFLIPLSELQNLLSETTTTLTASEYKPKIRQQLMRNQQRLFTLLSQQTWQRSELGEAMVPTKVNDFMSCWGDSNTSNKEAQFLSVKNTCRMEEQIYITNHFRTGGLELEFEWLNGETLGQHRFYKLYSNSIAGARPGNAASKIDVTKYQCQQNKITNANEVTNKTIYCLRAYKEFADLYDVLFIAATLNHEKQGLISHFTLAGVAKEPALTFTKQFVDAISWQ